MIYKAKKDTKYTMTRYELKVVKRLRRISILKNIPMEKWTIYEREDLINEHFIYSIFNKEKKISIKQFLEDGLYEHYSVYENLKSNTLEPVIEKTTNKKIKFKK